MMRITLWLLVVLLLPIGSMQAHSSPRDPLQTGAYFNVGSSVLDMRIMNQEANLQRFVGSLQQILADSNYTVKQVEVVGTASPDGGSARNMQLAGERAEALAAYIVQHSGITLEQIKVINGGENWAALRAMVASSDMPHRADVLRIIDSYAGDRDNCKRQLQSYAQSKPWGYMIKHFFPLLRMGSGSGGGESVLVNSNWQQVSGLIERSGLSDAEKRALLVVVQSQGTPIQRVQQIKEVCPPSSYPQLQQQLISGLLNSVGALGADNWALLGQLVAADANVPQQSQVLAVIKSVGGSLNWEQQLRALGNGASYRYIQDHFFPKLLVSPTTITPETNSDTKALPVVEQVSLGAENWKRLQAMVQQSNMPGKQDVLVLMHTVADPEARTKELQALNGGVPYIYFQEVFIPELLDDVSPASQENWVAAQGVLQRSDMNNKDAVLQVMLTTPAGAIREQAIRDLDGGASWSVFGEELLPELLGISDQSLGGSGVRFSYGLSEGAKAREIEGVRRARVLVAQARIEAMKPVVVAASVEQTPKVISATPPRYKTPVLALKTNLLFDLVTAVNLEIEVPLADRWSIVAAAVFPQWHYDNRHSLILTDISVEGRFWLSKTQGQKWGKERNSLTGHFVGVYGNWLPNYDFQYGKQGVEGNGFGFGITYGFVHRLGRSFNMEYSLGVGGVSVQGKQFTVRDDYEYKVLKREYSGFYFVPTRAKISLVWLIGNKK